ncbi:hypothetical protein ABOZ73_12470 [Caulobacter sp. 73W]|uniref:Uncharacterized protein n=1 Tax=Caulobacter sp. 73W TaxID=3161137 RepID=A0AB39KQN2_9CAUL
MLTIALLAAVAGQPAYQPAENNRPVPACIARQVIPAVQKTPDQRLRASRLGELPNGVMELTVDRRVDGCPAPVIVRNDAERNLRTRR